MSAELSVEEKLAGLIELTYLASQAESIDDIRRLVQGKTAEVLSQCSSRDSYDNPARFRFFLQHIAKQIVVLLQVTGRPVEHLPPNYLPPLEWLTELNGVWAQVEGCTSIQELSAKCTFSQRKALEQFLEADNSDLRDQQSFQKFFLYGCLGKFRHLSACMD